MLKLVRLCEEENTTLGMLVVDGFPRFTTCELGWNDNKVGLSCIPIGSYLLKKYYSGRFGVTYEVQNVPERSNIIFHVGNISTDSSGCILLGLRYTRFGVKPGILDSAKAIEKFQDMLKEGEELEVVGS